jgi:hypothetical protein
MPCRCRFVLSHAPSSLAGCFICFNLGSPVPKRNPELSPCSRPVLFLPCKKR